jgi:hypothetical protein
MNDYNCVFKGLKKRKNRNISLVFWLSSQYKNKLSLLAFSVDWVMVLFFPFIHLFICSYNVCAISLPCPPPPFSFPHPLNSRQNLFCHFLQFYWTEDISNNKKDKVFLLVEIRITIQRFLALFPFSSVLQPEFIHLYQTSLLLPVTFPYWPQPF